MTDDPFEADLDALFAEATPFADADAFAQAVERRLEPAPAFSPMVRNGLLGLAAVVGGAAALAGLRTLVQPVRQVVEQAASTVGDLAGQLGSVPVGIDPNLLWMAAGLAAAGLAVFRLSEEA